MPSDPSTPTDLVIRTYGPSQVPPLLDGITDIWADAHPELVDNPGAEASGLSVPALRRQVQGHLKHAGFALVVAYVAAPPSGSGTPFRAARPTGLAPGWWTRFPKAPVPNG